MLRSSLSSCSVGIFRRAPVISYSLRNAGEVRAGGGAYAEKERTQENFAVTQKDAELLKKLRETLKLEEGAPIPPSIVTKLSEANEDRKETLAKKWKVPKEETLA